MQNDLREIGSIFPINFSKRNHYFFQLQTKFFVHSHLRSIHTIRLSHRLSNKLIRVVVPEAQPPTAELPQFRSVQGQGVVASDPISLRPSQFFMC